MSESKTILVVDDEMLIAMDIQSQLEELGHKVLISVSVTQAVGVVDRETIDLAIVDWHLGHEISTSLVDRLIERRIPVLLCSGSGMEELSSLFPATPIILKPFAANALVAAVVQVIGGESIH